MPKFFYIARDKEGNKIRGSEETSDQEELIGRLQAKDLVVINILSGSAIEGGSEPKTGIPGKKQFRTFRYHVTSRDLVLLCRQLATLLGAGVTILKSLQIISQQVASRKLYDVIIDLAKNMEQGLSLHEAMSRHRKIFSDLWVNLVESGEASGNLALVLERLATYLEKKAEFKRKIISALIYPLILVCVGTGALLFLTVKIIPTFAEIFENFDVKLPLLTRMLIAVSLFIRTYAIFIIISLIALAVVFRNYIKTKDGRRNFERLQFRLPIFGEFFRSIVVERFSSELSTLIESGVPILYSLEISEQSVGSLIMGDVIRQIKENVREGKSLSQPLEKSGFFEPMVVQMVLIGEEIGELSSMFKKISIFYQEQVETFIARFISMFEPFMLLFMGLVIGTMIIGMFLPIFEISQVVSQH